MFGKNTQKISRAFAVHTTHLNDVDEWKLIFAKELNIIMVHLQELHSWFFIASFCHKIKATPRKEHQ